MPGIPIDTDISKLRPASYVAPDGSVSTAPGERDGSGGGTGPVDPAGVIFSESFDEQPDYFITDHHDTRNNSAFASKGETVPAGWSAAIGDFMPDSTLTSMEISDAVGGHGGSSKSLILRRITNVAGWRGEGELSKDFSTGKSELYVSFWMKWQPGWLHQGMAKVFRIGSYPPGAVDGDYWSPLGMGVLWQNTHSANTGVRNALVFRQGPYRGEKMLNPTFANLPTVWSQQSSTNNNFTNHTYDLDNDGAVDNDPQLVDRANGGVIPNDGSFITSHDILFGDAWNQIEFYVKINSEPGAQDGVVAQWLNGSLVFLNKTVPWLGNDADPDQLFTTVKFGGNSYTQTFLPEHVGVDRIEWSAISDIVVRDSLPTDKGAL